MARSDGSAPTAEQGQPSGIDLARAALVAARARARTRTAADGAARRRAESRSGARPDDRDPQPLGAAVERLLAERGWDRPMAVAGVIGRWAEIVGPEVASHCRPERLDDGVLWVAADSGAWATQVRWLSGTLLGRLEAELGRGVVKQIRVGAPGAPPRRGRLRAPGSRGARQDG